MHLQAIVVGNVTDYFVYRVTSVLGNYGISFSICEDIYKVVAELARGSYENVLVIGRVEKLGIEKGRFFSKMNEKGFRCCCLAENGFDNKLKDIKGDGVTIITEPAQIEEVIAEFSADNWVQISGEKEGGNNASNFNKDDFLTTQAEMDALLGN